jgi:hypothetical protein
MRASLVFTFSIFFRFCSRTHTFLTFRSGTPLSAMCRCQSRHVERSDSVLNPSALRSFRRPRSLKRPPFVRLRSVARSLGCSRSSGLPFRLTPAHSLAPGTDRPARAVEVDDTIVPGLALP